MDILNIFLVTTSAVAFAYTVQLFYFDKIRLRSGIAIQSITRRRAQRLRAGPVVCWILAIVALVPVLLPSHSKFEACSPENNEINPDVGGIGVLFGLFLPCLVLLVVLFLGHFTAHTSGAKELCMAQFANLLYLTINLAKGMKRLNVQELGIAISSVDAASASISMAFSDKDVLAARKLVLFGFLTQLAAYGVQARAFHEYSRRESFLCNSSTTNQALPQSYSEFYWAYWACRFVASTLPCEIALRLTSGLNKIEHKSKASQSPRVKATALWGSLPATLATNYLVYGSFALLHGLSIYNILRGTNTIKQSWLTLTTEWGQSANAIIAIFAVGHVAYAIVYRLFVAESRNEHAQNPGLSGQSISQGNPQTGWMAWKHWPWNAKWWPFHLGLDYSDHLLVDHSMLQRVLNPALELDPVVRHKLWKELMDGFVFNDLEGILDCLIHGAQVDKPNDDGDYPIHLAARYDNTDILMRTRFTFDDDIDSQDSLLLRNSAGETPLEIACIAEAHEAVRWILGELPQGHEETQAAVTRAYRSCTRTGRGRLLKILQRLWPGWRP